MMKWYNLVLIFLSVFWVINCSNNNSKKSKTIKNEIEPYVRYFRDKRITSRNQYRHIYIRFEQEILGSPDEIEQTLKSIEKEKGSYYKVYYDTIKNTITGYGFFQEGILIAQAKYIYGSKNDHQKGKLVTIDYYDEKLEKVAFDTISYNQFGRPIQTERYIMPGKRLLNIF